MAIYRGAGGAGDATADSSSEALLIRQLVAQTQISATSAATSATNAATSETSAATSATNAATSETSAASSASAATTTLASSLLKANNLSDLVSASTARTNLGLGTAATTNSTAYATAAQGTTADSAFADRLKWDGGATGLDAATGRTSLGLGTAATTASTAYATSAQGTKADSALQPAAIGSTVQAYDAELQSISTISVNGLITRTSGSTAEARTITGTTNVITVTNGDGVAGNPTLTVGSLVARTDTNQSFTVSQRGTITALTDGATITPNMNNANNFSVTLAGNRTLANPTNLTAGQSGVIVITQDATGSRTLAYGSNFKFPGGTAPTLTTTASAVDVLAYYVESATRITARLVADVK